LGSDFDVVVLKELTTATKPERKLIKRRGTSEDVIMH
jgi:hypothetical protein